MVGAKQTARVERSVPVEFAVALAEIQAKVTATREKVYEPIPENVAVYAELYELYHTLHDAFGTWEWSGNLHHVMKKLLEIRERQR